jgi:mersacidin/lichenicidin family type 2 lantibiotic
VKLTRPCALPVCLSYGCTAPVHLAANHAALELVAPVAPLVALATSGVGEDEALDVTGGSAEEIIRSWKDPDYRDDTLSIDHPAGHIELTNAAGGAIDTIIAVISEHLGTCGGVTCFPPYFCWSPATGSPDHPGPAWVHGWPPVDWCRWAGLRRG